MLSYEAPSSGRRPEAATSGFFMNISLSQNPVPDSDTPNSSRPHSTPFKKLKLRLLQEKDKVRKWSTLDDRRLCLLCGNEFSGIEVRISVRNGKPAFQCPDKDCQGTLGHFVHPGNPLLSDETWDDWMLIEEGSDAGEPEWARG